MIDCFKERKQKVQAFQSIVRSRSYEEKESNVPEGLYKKCQKCGELILNDDLACHSFVCPHCNYHFRITAKERINLVADAGSFREMFWNFKTNDPLNMPDYKEKLAVLSKRTDSNEAVLTGICKISGHPFAIAVMDSHFLMGSMGCVVGERITRLCEYATEKKLPLVIVTTSGGARMQEGILSLMQMAKTVAAIKKHSDAGLLYLSVLTDPTMGGVSASFAMMADVIIAEPNALIGFAGPRVIKQTIKQELPKGFQTSEFLLKRGLIDMVVSRSHLKETLARISEMFKVRDTVKLRSNSPSHFINHVKPQMSDDLVPMDKVRLARHGKRPNVRYYINQLFDDFLELQGDRMYADDKAILGGVAQFDGMPVTVIGHLKGTTTEENIQSNFAMSHPEGYRKAIRLAKQAEKFKRPIITFIDTPGAYPGIGAEERGQSEAIGQCLTCFMGLKVPVIALVIGEGGSGGALAIGAANYIMMLEHSVYSILSPEGFASILYKDVSKAKEAAAHMKLTAKDLLNLKVIDEIIEEPVGGAHENPSFMLPKLKASIIQRLREFGDQSQERIVQARYEKFSKMGRVAALEVTPNEEQNIFMSKMDAVNKSIKEVGWIGDLEKDNIA
ncbi:MAG: acetyl-CoA carboxylase carboxyltransferase subunit alpha [Defluviitaleaceae bacterium]|nr:acetyl-CoA carboxylase carboxyltransferase subunit alpha [Defluviitaleaceae bacterium]